MVFHTGMRWLVLLVLSVLANFAMAATDVSYLLTAASKGDIETVNAMLNSGVNPNTQDQDHITALMYAARKNRADVASGAATFITTSITSNPAKPKPYKRLI